MTTLQNSSYMYLSLYIFDHVCTAYLFFIPGQDLIFPINNALPVTDFLRRGKDDRQYLKIDNLLNADKENLPLPKEDSMTANSEETNNLLTVDKENLAFPAVFKKTF